jgi:hypothetical protein
MAHNWPFQPSDGLTQSERFLRQPGIKAKRGLIVLLLFLSMLICGSSNILTMPFGTSDVEAGFIPIDLRSSLKTNYERDDHPVFFPGFERGIISEIVKDLENDPDRMELRVRQIYAVLETPVDVVHPIVPEANDVSQKPNGGNEFSPQANPGGESNHPAGDEASPAIEETSTPTPPDGGLIYPTPIPTEVPTEPVDEDNPQSSCTPETLPNGEDKHLPKCDDPSQPNGNANGQSNGNGNGNSNDNGQSNGNGNGNSNGNGQSNGNDNGNSNDNGQSNGNDNGNSNGNGKSKDKSKEKDKSQAHSSGQLRTMASSWSTHFMAMQTSSWRFGSRSIAFHPTRDLWLGWIRRI